MCSIIALLVFIFAGFFGYGISSSVQVATVEPVAQVESPEILSCASAISADADVENMLGLVGDTFAGSDWQSASMTMHTEKNTSTWFSDSLGAVAYLEYLLYDCGVSEDQLKALYSDTAFQTLFTNYSTYEMMASCEDGDTHLLEFKSVSNDYSYHVLYWVKPLSPTRAMTFMLVFPETNPAGLAEVAAQLFPELPTCAPAAA